MRRTRHLDGNVNPRTPVSISSKNVAVSDAWEVLMLAYGLDCMKAGNVAVVGHPRKI
ncbi:MAG: hypothetical protein FJZ00_08950 [Candidatus Sericytochromatia bacterium]|uniref:Uncharacterized protein n=1 Tax=Candidatus Tanganyikabacteria bacterium TaxID=2961651 RepID=A0A938BNJ8_9BACT|nr:hypothetical protein [Candidatus Tanganyikabacteria bacterium]